MENNDGGGDGDGAGRRDPNSQTLHWFAHVGPDGDKQNIQVAVQEQANHNALPGRASFECLAVIGVFIACNIFEGWTTAT